MKATLMVNVSLRFFDGRGRFVLPKILRDKMNYDGFGKNKCKKIILRATGCYLDI